MPSETPVPAKQNWTIVWIIIGLALLFIGFLSYLVLSRQLPTDLLNSGTEKVATENTVFVSITEQGFVPATIQVKKNTKIAFVNNDSTVHQVASDPHPTHEGLEGFESLPLQSGESYSFVFKTSGTFSYHDHLNPINIKGNIVVE
jgi:plastocyanin